MEEKFPGGWTAENVNDRLHNPCYCGADRMGDRVRGSHYSLKNGVVIERIKNIGKSTALVVWDCHDAIVSRETWEKVQAKYPHKQTEHHGHKDYVFSGLVKCGVCGKKMTGQTDKNGAVRYRCPSVAKATNPICKAWGFREDELLGELIPALVNTLDKKTIGEMNSNPFPMASEGAMDAMKGEADKLEKELRMKLDKMHWVDDADMPEYKQGMDETRQRLHDMKKQIADMEPVDFGEYRKRLNQYLAETRLILVEVSSFTHTNPRTQAPVRYSTSARVEPATLRSTLKSLGTSITLWFDRSPAERNWSRTRTLVEGELGLVFEGFGTPTPVVETLDHRSSVKHPGGLPDWTAFRVCEVRGRSTDEYRPRPRLCRPSASSKRSASIAGRRPPFSGRTQRSPIAAGRSDVAPATLHGPSLMRIRRYSNLLSRPPKNRTEGPRREAGKLAE